MRAVVIYPGQSRPPEIAEVGEPGLGPGQVRVRVLEVGVCGTDREILAGGHGVPPAGEARLVLGHESLGVVEDAAADAGPSAPRPGDLVVATVRRPCHHCRFCADGMSDFCETADFVERGILGMDGFMAERYVDSPSFMVRIPPELRAIGVLIEPLSVVEKAVQQTFATQARIPGRPTADLAPWRDGPGGWRADRALVLGAGPIGILAALLLRLAGVPEVVAIERTERPTKRALLARAGIGYRATGGGSLRDLMPGESFDLILEATGSSSSVVDALPILAANGVMCLTGVFPAGLPSQSLNLNDLFREMLYRNQALVTTVNSNRAYFERGVQSMSACESRWPGLLAELITRRVPMERFADAVVPERNDVKTVVEVATG